MPFLTDEALEAVLEEFEQGIEVERDTKKGGIWYNTFNRWVNGKKEYRGPGDRIYQSDPPCLPLQKGPSDETEFQELQVYYVKFLADGSVSTTIHKQDISIRSNDKVRDYLDAQMKKIVPEIRSGQRTSTQNDPDSSDWNKPCLIAVFLDHPAWKLVPISLNGVKTRSFSFHLHDVRTRKKGSNTDLSRLQKRSNWSFCNARHHEIDLDVDLEQADAAIENIEFLSVENHHLTATTKGKRRNDKGWIDHYKFDLFYTLPVAGTTKSLMIIIDPGGKNTGPGGNV